MPDAHARGWGDLPDRIRTKIAPTPDPNGCWVWIAGRDRHGYGFVHWENRLQRAHRAVYSLLRGNDHEGLDLDHLCRVRHCVNPDHLEPVTRRVNALRGVNEMVQLHNAGVCARGHDAATEALRRKNGPRAGEVVYCRACRRERRAERKTAA